MFLSQDAEKMNLVVRMNTNSRTGFPVLDNDLLKTFVAIVETGNFRRAAKVVYRTPSAVSMQIKKLEDAIGRSLFDRDAKSVILTPDGEALLGFARRMLQLSDETVGYFREPALEGAVRFGAPDDFGTRFLPNILARFAATHPGVDVEVFLEPSSILLERLEEGILDITLITSGSSGSMKGTEEIVFTEPLVWIGLRGGLAWEKKPLPLALAGHDCSWRGAALDSLDRAGVRYRIAYSSQSGAGQMAAVLADLAIAPFPESLVEPPYRRLGAKENLPILGNYHIALCRRPDIGAAAKALAKHVSESFRDFPRSNL